jgi:hypothetical protein
MKQLIITDVTVIRLQPKTTAQQTHFITKSKGELLYRFSLTEIVSKTFCSHVNVLQATDMRIGKVAPALS